MEIGTQIRKHRAEMKLSQEELAEKVYVTRQTISNWENGKSYPDIHSLLLLSVLFNVSLDQLVKGDIETMKREVDEAELKRLNRYACAMTVFMLLMIISPPFLFKWIGPWSLIPFLLLAAAGMYFALKIEKIKKANDIGTYKEILAFTEGRKLDEMEKQREIGKRPYQRVLLAIGSAVFAAVALYFLDKLVF